MKESVHVFKSTCIQVLRLCYSTFTRSQCEHKQEGCQFSVRNCMLFILYAIFIVCYAGYFLSYIEKVFVKYFLKIRRFYLFLFGFYASRAESYNL